MRISCKGNIEGTNAYVSISRAQTWHQIYLLHELWTSNDDEAKLQYFQKATKLFAYFYDEGNKACKTILDRIAISTTNFGGEGYLHYFTTSNNCKVE